MARKKTIEVKGKKASLAYITEEEKKLLLERDKAKGSIAEKFHNGVPVLFDPDIADEEGTTVEDVEADPGIDEALDGNGDDEEGGGGDSDADRIACERAGGTWENGACVMSTDEEDEEEEAAIDETWENHLVKQNALRRNVIGVLHLHNL